MSRLRPSCVLVCAVLLAACGPSVEVPDDVMACAEARCTAGECYATGGQPACRCGAWEVAAKLTCAVAAFEEPDDHGGSPADATVLTLPMTRRPGRIERGRRDDMTDRDLFVFTSEARHVYVFRCGVGTLPHCKVRLLDASGKLVPLYSRWEGRTWLSTVLLDAGTWYLEVSGAGEHGTYTYELVDLGADDHADTRAQATPLRSSRESFPVQHSYQLDTDFFTFPVVAGHGYRFSCVQQGGMFHTLAMTTSTGERVDFLESPDTNSVTVRGRATAAASWYVELRAAGLSEPSTSSCRFEDLGPDEHADTTAGATRITPNVTVPVALQWKGDVDVLAFDVEPGHRYIVHTEPRGPWDVEVTSDVVLGWHATTDTVDIKRYGTGTYHLHVRGGPPSVPAFLLVVEDLGPDDHGDDAGLATPMTPGDVITGGFQTEQDTDAIAFIPEGSTLYRADCEPACQMSVSLPSGLQDGFVQVNPGRYLIDPRSYSRITLLLRPLGGSKGFTLRVTPVATDDHGDDRSNAASLTPPTFRSGVVQTAADVDAFTVYLEAGRTYRLVEDLGGLRLRLAHWLGPVVTPRDGYFVPSVTGDHVLTLDGASGYVQTPWRFTLSPL
ncbi:hypothetical protein ACLESD_18180 [Pyxidicoccus sp. 3LFB2]